MCKEQIFILLLILKTLFTSVVTSLTFFNQGDAPQYEKMFKVSQMSL